MHFSSWDLFGGWILGFGILLSHFDLWAVGFGSDLGPRIFPGSWMLDVGCSMLDAAIHQSINPSLRRSMTPLLHPSSPGRRTAGPGRRWKVLAAPGSQPPLPPERRAPACATQFFLSAQCWSGLASHNEILRFAVDDCRANLPNNASVLTI